MTEKAICLGCGKMVNEDEGFVVKGKQYIQGLPESPVVHDFQCLITWDATGEGMEGNQGFNLDQISLIGRT